MTRILHHWLSSFLLLTVTLGWFVLFPPAALAQTCTQTLDPSATPTVLTAVTNAAAGAVICLNNGNYGTVNFGNITKSGMVTVRSVSGAGAQMSPKVTSSRFIRFSNVTLTNAVVSGCSLNIEFINTPFVPGPGMLISQETCPNTAQNIVVDGATFGTGVKLNQFEGVLSCRDCNTVTIRNSTFGPNIGGDGIQGVGTIRNNVIMNNIFTGISQSYCDANAGGAHCDAIQFYAGGSNNTITGNFFFNNSSNITHHSGTPTGTIFSHNVFTPGAVQIGGSAGVVWEHNTLVGETMHLDGGTTATVRNNIFVSGASITTTTASPASTLALSTQMFSGSIFAGDGNCAGCTFTGQFNGTPVFVGGTNPTTYAGYRLAPGSPGTNRATDGTDVGPTFGGVGVGSAPQNPLNLSLQ